MQTIQSNGAPSYVTAFTDPYVARFYPCLQAPAGFSPAEFSLTTILMCRFILDLQEASQKDFTPSDIGQEHLSGFVTREWSVPLNFASAMESMGSIVGLDTEIRGWSSADDATPSIDLETLASATTLQADPNNASMLAQRQRNLGGGELCVAQGSNLRPDHTY